MHVGLAIGGLLCMVLALGHLTVGLRWVLPNLSHVSLPSTPFGPSSMTLGMVRFSWHIVTVVLVGFGVLLTILAFTENADSRTLLLRWFAAMWLAATGTAFWNGRRRPSSLLRLPVPLFTFVIAVLCWSAST